MARTRRVGGSNHSRAALLRVCVAAAPVTAAVRSLPHVRRLLLPLPAAAAARRPRTRHAHNATQRKKRTHAVEGVDPSKKSDPKTFVFRRGRNWVSSALARAPSRHTATCQRVSALTVQPTHLSCWHNHHNQPRNHYPHRACWAAWSPTCAA
jgi:hypothetical protein